ncbi:hypothetical protein V461_03885 [Pantoea ananatis BRT98]|nr:hypothetical protein V461_03885 [Pantoea ananatis BRT98]
MILTAISWLFFWLSFLSFAASSATCVPIVLFALCSCHDSSPAVTSSMTKQATTTARIMMPPLSGTSSARARAGYPAPD